MSYLVLGLGIVMAVLGGLAISNGYPIIQVERGWASVIAGAALLSGGVVTFSLGIVVRSLASVRAALLAGAAPMPYAGYAEQPAVADAAQRLSSPGAARLSPTVAAVGLGAVGASLAEEASAFHDRQSDHDAMAVHAEVPSIEVAQHQDHAYEPVAGASAHEEVEPAHAPRFVGSEPADSYALETPSTADHDLPVPAGAPPGDWLDRAFSELDLHVPEHVAHNAPHPLQSPVAALQPEIVPPPPAYEPAHAEPEPVHEELVHEEPAAAPHQEHAPEPVFQQAPEPAPVEHAPMEYVEDAVYHHAPHAADVLEAEHPPSAAPLVEAAPIPPEPPVAPAKVEPTSAVIGRYEADGTSYTMYADGSIEAQSSAGVYRFASMAELKAFIEG